MLIDCAFFLLTFQVLFFEKFHLKLFLCLFQDKFITVIQAKVTDDSIKDENFAAGVKDVDLIVSNPPYILRKDLKNLQPEIAMLVPRCDQL